MKPKFTQGDWKVTVTSNVVNRYFIEGITEVHWCKSHEETLANTYLMAAAPDMFKSLVAIAYETGAQYLFDTVAKALGKDKITYTELGKYYDYFSKEEEKKPKIKMLEI